MRLISRLHSAFRDKHPAAYLLAACAICYGLTAISPTTMGILDYFFLVVVTGCLYAAAEQVYRLKVAKVVFFIQPVIVFVLFMAMVDGFGPTPIGFWFENLGFLTTTLSLLELLALLMWTPWADISEGIYRAIHNIRFNTGNFDILDRRSKTSLD